MKPYYEDDTVTLHHGNALNTAQTLPSGLAQTIITSPPYFGLRDYGHDEQIGSEATVAEYVDSLVSLFCELRRVLADDGTLWLNLGDSYARDPRKGGSGTPNGRNIAAMGYSGGRLGDLPEKNLIGVPWRVAFALQDDGWVLRSDIIWAKPNPMPESVTDRPTKAHEYLFLFSKGQRYFYDAAAIAEPVTNGTMKAVGQSTTANKRTVWTVPTVPFSGAHFAVFPPELVRPCVRAGSRPGDVVLDPFSGSGTTGLVATQESRRYIGIDLNPEYLELSLQARFKQPALDLFGSST